MLGPLARDWAGLGCCGRRVPCRFHFPHEAARPSPPKCGSAPENSRHRLSTGRPTPAFDLRGSRCSPPARCPRTMMAASYASEVHRMVDQLAPAQLEALYVLLHGMSAGPSRPRPPPPRWSAPRLRSQLRGTASPSSESWMVSPTWPNGPPRSSARSWGTHPRDRRPAVTAWDWIAEGALVVGAD